jgi:hypothetical protein
MRPIVPLTGTESSVKRARPALTAASALTCNRPSLSLDSCH